ncbi:uncharacterized protein LOC132558612 isoform X2 [Ylistrum balloti]|uniref:uncharacterized protein LOC132558612 isoform X2 n=1 Tax=Ylistrum balloti TaxID=509963 RepID=UPI0029058B95|nr:uncharacterized protein LOC132558612 isoform X2 [Ylistrum balloti]
MEAEASTEAFEASGSNSNTPAECSTEEQYLVIPPEHVNEEVIVIDTTATDAHRVTRIKVGNQEFNVTKVEPQREEDESTAQPMDCSISSENGGGGEEMEAASSIMAIQAASYTKPLTFEVIESASQRGLPKLMDSFGYGYTLRRTSNVKSRGRYKGKKANLKRMYWRCAVRGKQYSCGAGVIQEGDDVFIRNDQQHGHLPKPDGVQQVKIRKQVKLLAQQNILDTGPALVNSVLLDNAEGDETECSRSIHSNLVRTANRIREKMKEKAEITVESLLQNVFQYFQNEERAGAVSNLNNPMKRLSEASGMPTRTLRKKLGLVNEKEIAIKRCVGGEVKKTQAESGNSTEDAIIDVLEDLEKKKVNFTTVNVRSALRMKYPALSISQVVLGRTLRKLGYQTRNTHIFDLELEKKSVVVHKKPEVIKLVRNT